MGSLRTYRSCLILPGIYPPISRGIQSETGRGAVSTPGSQDAIKSEIRGDGEILRVIHLVQATGGRWVAIHLVVETCHDPKLRGIRA